MLELIDFIAQHHELVLETGHVSAEEGLMVVHEAHQRGVTHIVVVTHAMYVTVEYDDPSNAAGRPRRRLSGIRYGSVIGPKPAAYDGRIRGSDSSGRPEILYSGYRFRLVGTTHLGHCIRKVCSIL